MLIVDNIGQSLRMLSITILQTLGSPYKLPGRVPIMQMLLNSSSDTLLLLFKVLKCSFNFFPKFTLVAYFYQYQVV